MMNLIKKATVAAILLLTVLLMSTGCQPEQTPYEINDGDGFNVSVKFDANGGFFTTNTSVIVDSYNISDLKTNEAGMVELALITPDDPARGGDAFTPVKNGHFLAGWYTERPAGNGSYSGGWDFAKHRLEIDPKAAHSSQDPELTLYAAWVPLFSVEYYALDTGELLDTYTFDPNGGGQILLPQWDADTGTIKMNDFPERSGFTFEAAYYDPEGTRPVEGTTLTHTGSVDYATATALDTNMKLYVAWTEGEWYHIYNAEQLVKNANLNGCYVLHNDLDFKDEIWPTIFMYGNFNGRIEGNGHTISNVALEQTNNSKVNAGLFGNLTEAAALSDLTFNNVTFTVKSGTRVMGTSYGLLAGTVSAQAELSQLRIENSVLQIDSGCYFGTEDYTIGLICGMGSTNIDASSVSCVATGANPDNVKITVTDGMVTLEFVTA